MNRSELRKVFIEIFKKKKKSFAGIEGDAYPNEFEELLRGIALLSLQKNFINIKDYKNKFHAEDPAGFEKFAKEFSSKYKQEVSSIFWEFVFDGTITPMINEGANAFLINRFFVTEYGKDWLESEVEPIPEYPKDYIKFLRNIPIDKRVLDYVIEALATFKNKHYFASAVMLGAASERILYILAESMRKSPEINTDEKKFIESLDKGETKQLLDKIYDILKKNIKNVIPVEVHREALEHINCIMDVTRLQRNDAVHSKLREMDREQLRFTLLAFPHACKRVYAFINWFRSKDKK